MSLRETMARHAQILTRLDHLGEEVIYEFKADGTTRTVRAVIDRQQSQPSTPGSSRTARNRAVLAIPVDDSIGITSVASGDRVQFAIRLGSDPVWCRVERIVSQDEGCFEIEVKG